VSVLLYKSDYVEGQSCARRALKAYRKLGLEGREGVKQILNQLVYICRSQGSHNDDESFNEMLVDVLRDEEFLTGVVSSMGHVVVCDSLVHLEKYSRSTEYFSQREPEDDMSHSYTSSSIATMIHPFAVQPSALEVSSERVGIVDGQADDGTSTDERPNSFEDAVVSAQDNTGMAQRNFPWQVQCGLTNWPHGIGKGPTVSCSLCGTIVEDSCHHFNCLICDERGFELCQACVLSGRHCSQLSHKLYTRTIGRNGVSKVSYGHLTSSDYLSSLSLQPADPSSTGTLDTARVEGGEQVKVEDRPKHSVDYFPMNSSTYTFSSDAVAGISKADVDSKHPFHLPRSNLYKESSSRTMQEWLVSDPTVTYSLAEGPYCARESQLIPPFLVMSHSVSG